MTNAEKRERRREAGRRAAQARAEKRTAQVVHSPTEPPQLVPPTAEPPRRPTAEETARRAESAEAKRLTNLRAVLRTAQEIRRESDLYNLAHLRRWHHSPKRWTPEQIDEARKFLASFIRPDGQPQADPIRRKGRWRL
jgi:hypothetical protein